jgi:hypothetical protein
MTLTASMQDSWNQLGRWTNRQISGARSGAKLVSVRAECLQWVNVDRFTIRLAAETLTRGGNPPAAEREWVDLGLMEVKELDDVAPKLANALMDVDYDFKHVE